MRIQNNNTYLTREKLTEHYSKYPKMEIIDIFKFIYQSSFGCEHLVSDRESVVRYIEQELKNLPCGQTPHIDVLDGPYVRVHLSCIGERLTADELGELFCLSATHEEHGREALISKLLVARELIVDGALQFSVEEFDSMHRQWQEMGYPAVHHSDTFRSEYHPAYRVISEKYLDRICFN